MDGPVGAPDEAAVKALIRKANAAFPKAGWESRSRLNVSPDFTRDLDRFAEFLTLVGLLSLVVGEVGVANAAQGFVERKRTTLAILKAIGASGASVVALALVEFALVALAGALAGAAVGVAIPFAVDGLFSDIIPIPLAPSVDPRLVLLGVAYGLLTALAFSIPPLGRAHDLPVTTLIRDLPDERHGESAPATSPARRSPASRSSPSLFSRVPSGRSPFRSWAQLSPRSSRCGSSRSASLSQHATRESRVPSRCAWRLRRSTAQAR